jgi:hypothetical protein
MIIMCIDDIERCFGGGSTSGSPSGDLGSRLGEAAERDPGGAISRVLDVLEGLWTSQSLQEGRFDAWFTTLLATHRTQVCMVYMHACTTDLLTR